MIYFTQIAYFVLLSISKIVSEQLVMIILMFFGKYNKIT